MELYQFQNEAVTKFHRSGSLLVAIVTGGGKTVVAIKIILDLMKKYGSDFRCLVVVPANLRTNIVDNLMKFKIKINAEIVTKSEKFDEAYNKNNVLIISYNFLRMYYTNIISNKKWHLVVCDEIHYAKNAKTINFKVLWALRQQTKHFLGLTASPIANTPEEFFNIVSIVANDRKIYTEGMKLITYTFVGARKVPAWRKILFGEKDKKGQPVPIGIKDVNKFKELVGPWVYIPKMEKIQAVGKRPEIKSYTINIELTKFEIQAYYYALKKIPKQQLNDLKKGTITDAELRKIKNTIMACQQTLLTPDYIYIFKDSEEEITKEIPINTKTYRPGSKMKAVAKYLQKTGEKSIVFSMFLNFGARLMNQYLNEIGIKSKEYSGRVKPQERQKIVDDFENGDLQVICLTGAGQEGINLPSCKNVIFLTLGWHEEIVRQVVGRALRITSKNPFVKLIWVFALVNGKETIDHWMSRLIKRKAIIRNAIFNALEEDGMSVAALTTYEYFPKHKKQRVVLRTPYPEH